MEKEILRLGNPLLYEVSKPVKREELSQLPSIIQDLHDTLQAFRSQHHSGRAIAAPQIGIQKRILYLFINQPIVLINPEITLMGDSMIEIMDDCMSFPNLLVKVQRYKNCRIRYRDLEWNEHIIYPDDNLSELLQHEYDHLDGILATMRAIDNHSFYLKQE